MATAIAKVCKRCGTDLSAAKRLKNSMGEYFCQPCADALRSTTPPAATPQQVPTEVRQIEPATQMVPDPKRLAPGEFDAFFEPAVITLLQRQVAPEPLLMACDLNALGSAGNRTFLLTPTKIVCATLKRNAGLLLVADRRDLPLDKIEGLDVTVNGQRLGRKKFIISFLSGDGLERWETIYSSGPRLVEGAKTLQSGGKVDPFIRTTEELAQSNAAKSIWQQPMNVMLGIAFDRVKKRVSPFVAAMMLISVISACIAIWGVISLTSYFFADAPASTVSRQSDEEQKREQAKQAAIDFTNRWVNASTVADLDPRALEEVRKIVGDLKLQRFDGDASFLGDNTITVFATGMQYPVYEFQISPVVALGSEFAPMTMTLSVAKDSIKVIAVMPKQ